MGKKLENIKELAKDDRSSEEIKQDLATKEENVSKTLEQLGERIEEKLDWRGYMKKSPFLGVGAAIGLGFLAAGVVRRHTTPMERLEKTLKSSIRGAMYGIAGPGLIKVTLLGIASRTAIQWLNKAPAVAAAGSTVKQRANPESDAAENTMESEAGGFEPPTR